jgi:methionine biosynthesis protein MetW
MTGTPTLGSDERFYETKASLYSEAENEVVLRQVLACLPLGGRVLDVGCGSGVLLGQLAGRAGYRAGVELSTTAAAAASMVADEIVNAPVTGEVPFPDATFDVVVCADILEHLPDPAAALSAAVRVCRPGGAVVISVPNIANWQARLRLLRGVWQYEPTGLFDSGHLRFLTEQTLFGLVAECGLTVEACGPARLPPLGVQVPAVMRLPSPFPELVSRSWAVVGYRLACRWPTIFAYQLVCTARRPA